MDSQTVLYTGGCHCGRVRWEAEGHTSVVAWRCNCSICSMKGNINFSVPSSKFKLIGDSKQYLTTYTFGTHTAKHIFCQICGISSFYIPRTNPNRVSLRISCLDPGKLKHAEIRTFDGQDWEKSYVDNLKTFESSVEQSSKKILALLNKSQQRDQVSACIPRLFIPF